MQIKYQLNRKDFKEYVGIAWKRLYTLTDENYVAFAWNLVIYIPLGVAAMSLYRFLSENSGSYEKPIYIAVAALVAYFALHYLGRLFQSKRHYKWGVLDKGWFLAPSTLTLTDSGIVTRTENQNFELTWKGILSAQESNNLVLLFFDGMGAIVIPKRSFNGEKEKNEFMEIVKSKITLTSQPSPTH